MALAAPDAGVPGVPEADTSLVKDYIVGFHDAIPRGLDVGDTFHGGTVTQINIDLVFAVVRTETPGLFQVSVAQDDSVRYVEWDNPHYAIADFVPNDARYNDAGHYGSKKIGAEAAWDRTLGTTAIKVGVIDSGLRKSHQDIARYTQGYDFYNNDNNPEDNCGHGTHVTGTIAATINNGVGIAGMAQVTVVPIKGLEATFFGCSGGASGLANALQYAADQGSHISSNSWGGGTSTAISDAIDYAHSLGTVQIAAAGNAGPCTNCVSEPWKSKASKVIIVASTDSNDQQSSFSSEGNEIDVAAPGSSILSSYNSNDASYATLSGTSMATPHVSGTAALMFSLDSSLTFADVDSTLKNTAVDLGPSGFDVDFGYGRINADAATAAIGGGGGPSPQCSDGIDNDGDGLIDYPNDPGCTDANDDDETNAPPPPPPGTVFEEDFDDASAQGWTVNGGTTLWHMNSGCGSAHSGAYKLVWADSGSCTYNVGDTGFDWVKTPAIDLSGYSSATLDFFHWFETESYSGGAYDVLRVQRSCDNSAWTLLEQWDSRDANILSWTGESYDVSACAGGNLWVRWTADTIDGSFNNYDGWRIDSVTVTAS